MIGMGDEVRRSQFGNNNAYYVHERALIETVAREWVLGLA